MEPRGITYIYNGAGSWPVSVEQTYDMLSSRVDKGSIRYTDTFANIPEDTSLFVVPGGNAGEMVLQEGQKVTQFVKSGGRYLGICAGATAACRVLIRKPQIPFPDNSEMARLQDTGVLWTSKIDLDSSFSLHDKPCIGRHIVKVARDSGHTDNFCAARVRHIDQQFHTSLYSGPAFIDLPADANVLLHYESPVNLHRLEIPRNAGAPYTVNRSQCISDNSPAAVFAAPLGAGLFVLSGIHPEFNPKTFDTVASTHRFTKQLPAEVIQSEDARQALLARMFEALKL